MPGVTTPGVLHNTEVPQNNTSAEVWAALQDLEPLHCMKPSAHRVYFTFTQKPAVRKERRNYSLPHREEVVDVKGTPFSEAGGRVPWVHCKPKIFALALPHKRIEQTFM